MLIFYYLLVAKKLAAKLFWMRFMPDNSDEKTYIENMSDDDRDIDIESDVCVLCDSSEETKTKSIIK